MDQKYETALEEQRSNYISTEHCDSHVFLHGYVKFDHGNIYVPGGSGSIRVKYEFPRLQPKYERTRVEDRDLKALCYELMLWVAFNFVITGPEQMEYFQTVVANSIVFVAYSNPLPPLYSSEFDLCVKFFAWIWITDDAVESAIENKIHVKELKLVFNQFLSILSDKCDNNSTEKFKNVSKNYPIFGESFDSLLQQVNLWKKSLPDYSNGIKSFHNAAKRYFSAMAWFCVDEIDGRHSIETFKAFRKDDSFAEGTLQFLALCNGVKLSENVSNSATMRRILDVFNTILSVTNDLLGMKRDNSKRTKASLINFMVLQKEIPLDVTVRQVCELLTTALIDYDLMKKIILTEFDNDDNLIKYLDILESLVDGHHMIYVDGTRYLNSTGSISLTR